MPLPYTRPSNSRSIVPWSSRQRAEGNKTQQSGQHHSTSRHAHTLLDKDAHRRVITGFTQVKQLTHSQVLHRKQTRVGDAEPSVPQPNGSYSRQPIKPAHTLMGKSDECFFNFNSSCDSCAYLGIFLYDHKDKWFSKWCQIIVCSHDSHDSVKSSKTAACKTEICCNMYFEDSEVDMTFGFYKLYVCPEYQWHIHVYNLGQGFSEL